MSKKKTEQDEKKNKSSAIDQLMDELIDEIIHREYSYMKKVLKQSGLEASLAYLANRQAESASGGTQAKRKAASFGRGRIFITKAKLLVQEKRL